MSARIAPVSTTTVGAGAVCPPVGVWLAATALLGRPCPVDEPYPHICRRRLPSGWLVQRRDCAAPVETTDPTTA